MIGGGIGDTNEVKLMMKLSKLKKFLINFQNYSVKAFLFAANDRQDEMNNEEII